MLTEIKAIVQKDRKLQLILFTGLFVQLILCLTAIGIYHPDQYFQLIEFSSFQLKHDSAAGSVWELGARIRPTLQVWLFSAYYIVCEFLTIHDPYSQLAILRVLLGLLLFVFFNLFTLYYLQNEKPRIRNWALLILNFSWFFSYTRTLFSSEMLAALFFFGGVFFYDVQRKKKPGALLYPWVTGFLFCLSFYFRFQMAFAIAGFVLWMVFSERNFKNIAWLGLAFLAGAALNTWLDHGFYHEWVFTPYRYYVVNIVEGKAASMGTASFLVYIGLLVIVTMAPPFSIFLLYYAAKASLKKTAQPLGLSVLFFIIGHCLVSHKEERFLFPILNVLPVLIGWGLSGLEDYYEHCGKWIARLIRSILIFSVGINCLVLSLLFFTPYSQMIHFSSQLKDRFREPVTIYCLPHTPFETDSRLPLVFYRKAVPHLDLRTISTNDSIRYIKSETGQDTYLATTYNQVPDDRSLLDSLGYKPVVYSSRMLWHINKFLHSRGINTINDIWVLYEKKPK